MKKAQGKGFNKKAFAISMAVLLIILVILTGVFTGLYFEYEPVESYRIVGYAMHDIVGHFDEIHMENYTHIIYGFVDLSANETEPKIDERSENALAATAQYIKDHNLSTKLMVSLGGGGISKFTRTEESRSIVVEYMRKLIDKYDLKGIDVDWEYPMRATGGNEYSMKDPKNYLALMTDFRTAFGKDIELSIALCGSITFMNDVLNAKMAKVLDFVNVMTYDMGLRDQCTFTETTASMYNAFLGGYKKSQLNFGLPFYSRCPDQGYDYFSYDQLVEMTENGTIKPVSSKNKTYALLDGHRLSFDTHDNLMRKVRHVKERGYGGVFCWYVNYNLDGSLMREANEILNGSEVNS